jgi:AcrR family transcriptional regulator
MRPMVGQTKRAEAAENGRYRQKERTRDFLLAGAREMMADGEPVTIQALAARTGVSRATIYRYFPSTDDLAVHAASPECDDPLDDAHWPHSPHDVPDDPVERAAKLVRTMAEWAFDHETEIRTLLRVSLEPDSEARGLSRRGRTSRHRWITSMLDALPDDVPPNDRQRLAAALHALFGSDAVVWTTDMAELEREDAVDVLDWMARALVQDTIDRRHSTESS